MVLRQEAVCGECSFTHGKPIVIDINDFPKDWKQKWCYSCRRFRDRCAFYPNKHKKDGLQDMCKKCDNAMRSVRGRENKA